MKIDSVYYDDVGTQKFKTYVRVGNLFWRYVNLRTSHEKMVQDLDYHKSLCSNATKIHNDLTRTVIYVLFIKFEAEEDEAEFLLKQASYVAS